MSEHGPEAGGTKETPPAEVPRIYVASLSDYNDGRLHGAWLNAARPAEEIAADIDGMLAASPEPGAEEWAIHDYDNFGALRLPEYESLETISAIALGIVEHGDAFAAWAWCLDSPDLETLAGFEEAYRGHWSSLTAYAEEMLEELGAQQALEQIPDWLQPYVTLEVAAFARDLQFSGSLLTVGATDGGVHVFERTDG